MTSYATVAQFRDYLKQVTPTAASDEQVQAILDRSTSIVDNGLGFSFAGYETGTKKVRGSATAYLALPAHEAVSVAQVVRLADGEAMGDWEELDNGSLYRVDDYGAEGCWGQYRYSVTADWGYGSAPASIVEVTLEIAVNIWRSRDAGRFSNVVGVEGSGGVGYEGALTPLQRQIIKRVRAQYQKEWLFA